ncbi:MAG: SCP2 sterol-binding domain-containing protein [Thermodesulfobacteriota bacterium]
MIGDNGDSVTKYKAELKERLFRALRLPVRYIPNWIDAMGAGVFIAAIVDGHPAFREKLKGLDGKVFFFDARDVKKSFYMHIRDKDIRVTPHYAGKPDVTMRGETPVLFRLLLGKEDPDTVFFSRRLEISGDTAAAICFKNILNSL